LNGIAFTGKPQAPARHLSRRLRLGGKLANQKISAKKDLANFRLPGFEK